MAQSGQSFPVVVHTVDLRSRWTLSEPAYDLWAKGKLLEELGIPDDGRTRVEIIGGEIVVSPGPLAGHTGIVVDIQESFIFAKFAKPGFPWQTLQVTDLSLEQIGEGYIPDLIVLDTGAWDQFRASDRRNALPEEMRLAVEVTSDSTAAEDRRPGPRRRNETKWNGYAREGLPFYLLVDRDPRAAKATLYTGPDPATGTYQSSQEWAFGETIVLPDPFGVEISTDLWQPWSD